jgi:26S proteasome regulatory subunit N10
LTALRACSLSCRVRLLCSPTDDESKLLASLHGLSARGSSNFIAAVKTAYLALKHRKVTHGAQRIVVFVGSPVSSTEQQLADLGASLAKNNVLADVVCLGENDDNAGKLTAFINAVNKGGKDTSRLLVVPAGVMPEKALMESPIYQAGMDAAFGGGGGGGAGVGGGGGGGVDASLDPELAHALRISAEEARMAEEAAARSGGGDAPAAAAATGGGGGGSAFAGLDEDELLQQALMLSMAETSGSASAPVPATPASAPAPASASGPSTTAAATEAGFTTPAPTSSAGLTTPPGAPQGGNAPATVSSSSSAAPTPVPSTGFVDPAFALSLLGELPGVDINDPSIQEVLRSLQGQQPGSGGNGGAGGGSGGNGGSGNNGGSGQ